MGKQAGRFQGDGLAAKRPRYESELPAIILSHEAYESWGEALITLLFFSILGICSAKATARSLGFVCANADKENAGASKGMKHLICSVMVCSSVAVFETHHATPEKLCKPAGWT